VPLRDASIVSSQDYINISLSELLADVYQDIANFVEAYRIGENNLMLQASYYCIENFASYWGIRVLSLLDHFHRLKFTDSNI
ncbi:MAG: DUF5063 domain-containing protein, partial [Bacteroidales bacterium]|nr:DUF5063 domain-containing protein [Bacteroidales bacterium]